MNIIVIDNYDSFVYNLVQYLGELVGGSGKQVKVYRNDEITVDKIRTLNPDYLVISPGPCTPKEAGVSVQVIQEFTGKIPILGVCLGHQAIAAAYGGKIVSAKQLMHGKTSLIYHDRKTIFHQLPNPFAATRYHSLVAERRSLPKCLTVTAFTKDNEIMGLRLKRPPGSKLAPVEGVQFHPESILTEPGKKMLKNFLYLRKRKS